MYHPCTQGIVEQTNAVTRQILRCVLSQMHEIENRIEILPIVEPQINSLLNKSFSYSPSFWNYRYHLIVPIALLYGKEETSNEIAGNFCKQMKNVWDTTY